MSEPGGTRAKSHSRRVETLGRLRPTRSSRSMSHSISRRRRSLARVRTEDLRGRCRSSATRREDAERRSVRRQNHRTSDDRPRARRDKPARRALNRVRYDVGPRATDIGYRNTRARARQTTENLTRLERRTRSRVAAAIVAARGVRPGGKPRASLCPERRLTSDQSPVGSSSRFPARESGYPRRKRCRRGIARRHA